MRWVKDGRAAISRIRRRVVSSRLRSTEEQLPAVGSTEADLLKRLYTYFDGRKHAFELLAARVSAQILGRSGAHYHDGELTRPGGDGGVDFVGRLDVGTPANNAPLVVLGQAKCIAPTSSIGPTRSPAGEVSGLGRAMSATGRARRRFAIGIRGLRP
jgi:hypothetical protein